MFGPTGGVVCSQCGLMHPQLPAGEVCPVAMENKVNSECKFNVDNFVTNIKYTLVSKMSEKNIDDPEKFVGDVILNMVKFIDNYDRYTSGMGGISGT